MVSKSRIVTAAGAVDELVASTSGGYVRAFICALHSAESLDDLTVSRLSVEIPDKPALAQFVAFIANIRSAREPVAPRSLAFALECTLAARTRFFQDHQVDVVWTGPRGLTTRASAAVVKDLIESAKHEIVMLSFASFRLPDAEAALASAAGRGVKFHILLESAEDSGGRLHSTKSSFFDSLPAGPTVHYYRWPPEQREHGALMHAKVIVVDSQRALATSANLTENALKINVELGLLVVGFGAPKKIRDQIFALIESKTFELIN